MDELLITPIQNTVIVELRLKLSCDPVQHTDFAVADWRVGWLP